MASIEEAIFARATSHGGLSALIGTRCYPFGHMPQAATATVPFMTYLRHTTLPNHTMISDIGPETVVVQVDVWAGTYASLLAVTEQLRAALRDWSGSFGGVTVQRSFYEGEFDLGLDPDSGLRRRTQEYKIWYA